MTLFAPRPHSLAFALSVALGVGGASVAAFASPPSPPSPPAASTASARASAPTYAGGQPDPPATMTRRKWVYDVRVRNGELSAAAPVAFDRGKPVVTPRMMGRFAIELYVGRELLERVRFDLPFLAPVAAPSAEPPLRRKDVDWGRYANARKRVEVPDLDRATYALLVDRLTGKKTKLVWPPVDRAPTAPPLPPASTPVSAASASSAGVPQH